MSPHHEVALGCECNHLITSTVPTDVTTWEWLFETDQHVPFTTADNDKLGWYSNAATHERINFAHVKQQATALSTVLVRDYGLCPGETVSVFSTNTIWYAVALWATLRVGELMAILAGPCSLAQRKRTIDK